MSRTASSPKAEIDVSRLRPCQRRATPCAAATGGILSDFASMLRRATADQRREFGRDRPPQPLEETMEIVGKKSQGLSVTTLSEDKTVIISFNDRSLNFYVTDSLKESLKETIQSKIDAGFQHFILNLDNVKIIDSCGVGLIIVANNVTTSKNCKLYLSNIKPFIVKIFEIMRISKHLAIFENEDSALQAIKTGAK
jgi:anti-anti-sigma factor